MATGPARDVLHHLRRSALLRDGGGLTDAQLLEYFVSLHDEAAFEAIVRRHGSMVLGVCQRVLHNPYDVEDAFQATFLVLVRKAASIRKRELLGNWLYGVAYRTALDARASAMRRQKWERQMSLMPEPASAAGDHAGRELRLLLDQELNRLPDKYRVAVVLCDLEGRTRRDAAQHLGVPVGTLSGRLTTAHRMLAKRLARHGLPVTAGALTAVLSPGTASASLPTPLLVSAVAMGKPAAAAISVRVAALAEGVLKTMLVKKLKIAAAILLLAGLGIGAGMLMSSAADDKAGPPPRVLQLGDRGRRVVWSPDGKTLAVDTKVEKTLLGIQYDRRGSAVRLWDVEKGEVRQTLLESTQPGFDIRGTAFSPDGSRIAAIVTGLVSQPNMLTFQSSVNFWDAETLALKQPLPGPGTQVACIAFSPDGKLLAGVDPGKKAVYLWNAATGALERTLNTGQTEPGPLAFAPDGKIIAVGSQGRDGPWEVTLWALTTGTVQQTLKCDHFIGAVAFSRDGKLIAGSAGGGQTQLWDVATGRVLSSVRGTKHASRSIVFLPDGNTLAEAGADGKIRLWDVYTGQLKHTLAGHSAEVYSLAVSPDGKTLASVSQDETLRLWPLK